jgi:hypothetical protein
MGQMHRVLATAVLLGLGIVALSLLGAGARRGSGEVAQVQRVEPAAAVATTQVGTPPPVRTPPTPPSGVTISTPVVVVTPTFAGPYPTRDPRTPVVPTAAPVVPSPQPTTRLLTPGPTHTPGPTPTNPPSEEQVLRAAFATALQDRLARGWLGANPTALRVVAHSVRIEGDWGYLGIRVEPTAAGGIAPPSGGIVVARKVNNQWQVAFPNDPNYHPWLEVMPDSLMPPQQRRYFS